MTLTKTKIKTYYSSELNHKVTIPENEPAAETCLNCGGYFTPKYENISYPFCDAACGAMHKKEQKRIAFKHDTYNLL